MYRCFTAGSNVQYRAVKKTPAQSKLIFGSNPAKVPLAWMLMSPGIYLLRSLSCDRSTAHICTIYDYLTNPCLALEVTMLRVLVPKTDRGGRRIPDRYSGIAANVLNKQGRIADKGWSSSFQAGRTKKSSS